MDVNIQIEMEEKEVRLIDADFFEEKIKESLKWVDRNLEKDRFLEGCKASLIDILSTLRNYTPTIDAVPVVHGHWKEVSADEMYGSGSYETAGFLCSNCGFDIESIEHNAFNYCPNCGAKMDETIS